MNSPLQASPRASGAWFRRFELAPSTGQTMDVLDGLRGLAVLAIFLRHSWGLSGSPAIRLPLSSLSLPEVDLTPFIIMMSNGVDLFFVLSGYLLARRFIQADREGLPRPDWRTYARTRAYRILPGYWFAFGLLVFVFLPALVDQSRYLSLKGGLSILMYTAVLQTAFPFSYGSWAPASPYWTLTIEVLFYALVPWVSRAFYRRRAWWGLAASAAITFSWLLLWRTSASGLVSFISDNSLREGSSPTFIRIWLSRQLPGFALSFGVGIFVAKMSLDRADRAKAGRVRWYTPLASFVAGLLVIAYAMRWLGLRSLRFQYWDQFNVMNDRSATGNAFYYLESPSMAIGFGLILFGLVTANGQRWSRPFAFRPLRLVGILGFSIYLWHMPFLYLYNKLPILQAESTIKHWIGLMGLVFFPLTIVSLLSFFLVEKPMILRGRRSAPMAKVN